MMEWIVPVLILVAAWFLVPMSVRSNKRSLKGRSGTMDSFVGGLAEAMDPRRAMIVDEMERRQNLDGEEADGDDEPLAARPEKRPS